MARHPPKPGPKGQWHDRDREPDPAARTDLRGNEVDFRRADEARDLAVGGVMVNEGPDFRAEHVPFGGVKSSGLGREGVRIALREMSETRVVID